MNILTAGQLYDDNKIIGYKGKGTFGIVYAASCATSEDNIALKICTSSNAEDIKRFKRENEMLYKLQSHPRIIEPVSAIKTYSSSFYYLMELADCSLPDYLTKMDTLSEIEKLKLFKQICEGLQHAHDEGVIHRDLWWDNVLIKNSEAKLNDFGRARDFSKIDPTYHEHGVWGKHYIVPPEFLFGLWSAPEEGDYIPGDVYALGIVLYFIYHNTPINQYTAITESINKFDQYNSLNGISYTSGTDRYDAWLKWVSGLQIEKNLNLLLVDDYLNTETNKIMEKLTALDYRKRYDSVKKVLEAVSSIIKPC